MKIPRKIPIIPKYLVLNSQALIFTSWVVIIFITVLIFFGLHKSIFTEITDVLIILAVLLFVFFFAALYMGMILNPDEPHVLNNVKENMEKGGLLNLSGIIWATSFFDSSAIISFIGAVIAILCLLYYFLAFGLYFLIVFLMMLYLVFYLAYGLVLRHSHDTKGDIVQSLIHSVMYTILYVGVFFILIQVIKVFLH